MIRSFRDRNTRRFFEGHRVQAFQGFADQAVRRLTYLDSAEALQDLAGLPSNRLEALRGDRAGQYSIRINAQWRICFRRFALRPCQRQDGQRRDDTQRQANGLQKDRLQWILLCCEPGLCLARLQKAPDSLRAPGLVTALHSGPSGDAGRFRSQRAC